MPSTVYFSAGRQAAQTALGLYKTASTFMSLTPEAWKHVGLRALGGTAGGALAGGAAAGEGNRTRGALAGALAGGALAGGVSLGAKWGRPYAHQRQADLLHNITPDMYRPTAAEPYRELLNDIDAARISSQLEHAPLETATLGALPGAFGGIAAGRSYDQGR